MWDWFRSLAGRRPAGMTRPGSGLRPALGLEPLDDRRVPSATALSDPAPLAEAVIARALTAGPDAAAGRHPATTAGGLVASGLAAAIRSAGGAAGAPDLPRGLPITTGLTLLADAERDAPAVFFPNSFAFDWLAAEIEKRSDPAPDYLPPHAAAESLGPGGAAGSRATRAAHGPDDTVIDTPGAAPLGTKVIAGPGVETWGGLPGQTMWIGVRGAPPPDAAPVAVVSGQMATAEHGGRTPGPRPDEAELSHLDARLFADAASFLCPVFPFDAAGLQAGLARFRDALEPVVIPLVDELFAPGSWWVSAVAVGAGIGTVVWSRQPASRRRPGPPAAGTRRGPGRSLPAPTRARPTGHVLEVTPAGVAG